MSGTSPGDNRASLADRMACTTMPNTRSKPTSIEKQVKRPCLWANRKFVFQTLAGSARNRCKRPGSACDQRSPGGIALNLADEGRTAHRDDLDRVGDGASARVRYVRERLHQLCRHRGPQLVELPEVRIEGALGEARLLGHVLDGHRGSRSVREQETSSRDELRPRPGAALSADFRSPFRVNPGQRFYLDEIFVLTI